MAGEPLTPDQRRLLRAALLDAFRTDSALDDLVTFQLDENPHVIAAGPDLGARVAALIGWAESQWRVDRLLQAALTVSSGNGLLRAVKARRVQDAWNGASVSGEVLPGPGQPVVSVAARSPGPLILAGYADGTLRCVRRDAPQQDQVYPQAMPAAIQALALTPDGQAAGVALADGTLRIWDLARGAVVRTLTPPPAPVSALTIFEAPERLLIGLDTRQDNLQLRSLADDRLLKSYPGHNSPVKAVSATPDWEHPAQWRVLSATPRYIRQWDIQAPDPRRAQIGEFDGPAGLTNEEIVALTISPDGESLCYSNQNGDVKVWHLAAGHVVYTFPAVPPAARVTALAVDTYGQTVVGGRADGGLSLWSVQGSRLLNDVP
jgi:WD40 repeat protein